MNNIYMLFIYVSVWLLIQSRFWRTLDPKKIFQIFWSFKKINLTCTYFNKQKTSYIWAIYMQHCNFTVLVDNCRSRSIKNHQFYTTSVLYCEKLEKEKSDFEMNFGWILFEKIYERGPVLFFFSFSSSLFGFSLATDLPLAMECLRLPSSPA